MEARLVSGRGRGRTLRLVRRSARGREFMGLGRASLNTGSADFRDQRLVHSGNAKSKRGGSAQAADGYEDHIANGSAWVGHGTAKTSSPRELLWVRFGHSTTSPCAMRGESRIFFAPHS